MVSLEKPLNKAFAVIKPFKCSAVRSRRFKKKLLKVPFPDSS